MATIDGIICTLFSFLIIGIAIYESWVVNTNGGAKNECWQVWINILVVCIINWLLGFISLIYSFLSCASEDYHTGISAILSLSFVQIGYHIWTMVINENIGESCSNMYEKDYPDLWDSFMLEVGMFFFYISCIGAFILISCGNCCFAIYQEDSNTKNKNKNKNFSIPVTLETPNEV